MIKTLLAQIRQYKKDTLLAPLCTAGEVLMEVLIPFVTAAIIDRGIEAGDMGQVYRYGALMLALALCSLCFGVAAGRFSARASTGFACNLRDAMYCNVQTFSFSNIDKFSTAGLVTRMTTDVTNIQNAFQMMLRIAVRAPLMLLCSMFMCFFISVRLSLIFLAGIAIILLIWQGFAWYYNECFDRLLKFPYPLETLQQLWEYFSKGVRCSARQSTLSWKRASVAG